MQNFLPSDCDKTKGALARNAASQYKVFIFYENFMEQQQENTLFITLGIFFTYNLHYQDYVNTKIVRNSLLRDHFALRAGIVKNKSIKPFKLSESIILNSI